jgi:hypothetical protein
MARSHFTLALLGAAAAAVPGVALAQVNPQPAGTGGYQRPPDMGPNDKAADSTAEQIRQGVQHAADRRAAEAARASGHTRPAKNEEVVAGALVADSGGVAVGKIEAVDPQGAVVVTAAGKAKIPLEAFGHNKAGLLVGMTKAEFEQIVATANQ